MGVGAYAAVVPRRRAGLGHVGPRAADVDLAARRRHLRRAGRHHRRPGRGPGARPLPRHRHRRPGVHRHPPLARLPGDLRRPEVGRDFPPLEFKWWKEEEPVISFADDGHWLWFDISGNAEDLPVLPRPARHRRARGRKNLVRTRTGRALQAIRDRDVAAEIMGVPEAKYKLIAFAISSFFAGIAGARVRLVRRPAATRVLGPRPVRRVHRHPADRRRRHGRRHAARRRSSSCCCRGSSRSSPAGWAEQAGGRRPVGGVLGPDRQHRRRTTSGFISTAEIAPGFPLPGERARRAHLRRARRSSSCCSSRSACTASGSRSATTGRAGRSPTDGSTYATSQRQPTPPTGG